MFSMSRRLSPAFALGFVLSFLVLNPATLEARVQAGEEPAVRSLIERYFTSFATKDLDTVTHLWSDKSPDLAQAKSRLKELFSQNNPIAVSGLRVSPLKIEAERATATVSLDISVVASGITSTPGSGKRTENLSLVKEGDAWKIWRDESAEAKLAERIIAAPTEGERKSLLDADPELLTVELRKALLKQNGAVIRKGDFAQAIAVFEITRSLAERLSDRMGIAQAFIGTGFVARLAGNIALSLENYKKALSICEAENDKDCIAASLTGIGIVHHIRGDYDLAIEHHRRVLALGEQSGNKTNIANALNNLGIAFKDQGNFGEALDQYRKSLAIFEAAGDQAGRSAALSNIGVIHSLRGEPDLAVEYYKKSLAIVEALGDKSRIPQLLSDVGRAHLDRGDFASAMSYFERSLEALNALGRKNLAASPLSNIGLIHYLQGDMSLALDYQKKALALREAEGDKESMATVLTLIGLIYSDQGDYTQALEQYKRSLSLKETMRSKSGVAGILGNIAEVYRSQGSYDLALENYGKGLALHEQSGSKTGMSTTMANIGLTHYLRGDYAKAAEFAERSARLARDVGYRIVLWRALSTLGRAHRAMGQPLLARRDFDESIATIESLRSQVAGGEREQQRSFERMVGPYYRMVELLGAQGDAEGALSYAERGKARVLLDVLRSGKTDVTKEMTAEEQTEEQRLKAAMVSLNTQASREAARSTPNQTQLADLKRRLEKARLDNEAFDTRLYAAHPNLKIRRGDTKPLSLEAARTMVDSRTALLEYVITEETTLLFAITSGRDGAARNRPQKPVVRLYDLKTKSADLAKLVETLRNRIANNDIEVTAPAGELYNLLIRPAQSQLQGKTRIIIVPDGILWDAPFQALRSNDGKYVVQTAAVSYAPSLTVLSEIVGSHEPKPGATLLAMGNPKLAGQTVSRSKNALMSASFEPLPEAERMVRGLAQIYGAESSKVFIGADAREDVLKAESKNYGILQLATHGVINNASPMYSHVVLARTEDSKEDGLLEAWEIMQMDLKADLAILSACDTARGRIGAGEGVIGLSWALFVAGCPTTVVSQWKVESSSTTELMLEFHRRLRTGAGKSEALRQAALKLLTDKRYSHPFYWAGFIVVGDGN